MLDMRFFRNPRFSAASGAVSLTFFSLFGSLFLLTQYLQSVHGFSPLKAGAVVIPQAAMMMMMAPLSTVFVRRFGNKLVVGFGLVVVAVSLGAFGLLSVDAPLWQILVITLLMGVGMGNVMAPATDSIMGSLPRAKAGVGSAMNDTTRQTGGAIGVAVLGSILASKFHSSMSAAAAGHHLPATVSSADPHRYRLGADDCPHADRRPLRSDHRPHRPGELRHRLSSGVLRRSGGDRTGRCRRVHLAPGPGGW